MNAEEFRQFGKAAVDYIADYMENIRERSVLPHVQPGYLHKIIPGEVPENGEDWRQIMKDMETMIMPGMTHWQSPRFHAYFPTASSYPSIVAEMLSSGIACIGFSWITSPACTELEVAVMNWIGKLIQLPEEFLNCSKGPGGGIIQGSASEATLVALLAAKQRTIDLQKSKDPTLTDNNIKSRLVAYSSNQSNSSVEKAGIIAGIPLRLLQANDDAVLNGDILLKAVKEDLNNKLIPCCLIATSGTTGTCAFDDLEQLGPICKKHDIWLHVDAAYAGAAFILPEWRHLMRGIQYCDSFNLNLHKWLLVNFDCSPMWVKDSRYLMNAFYVDRIYLKHSSESTNTQTPDYRHWQIPLGRRFRALKVWITMRVYGVKGLQSHIRKHIMLAKKFAELVSNDERFELVIPPSMGLVCFRLKGDDTQSKKLYELLMERKNIYLIIANFRSKLILRFVICSYLTEEHDVLYAWNEITTVAKAVLEGNNNHIEMDKKNICQNGVCDRNGG